MVFSQYTESYCSLCFLSFLRKNRILCETHVLPGFCCDFFAGVYIQKFPGISLITGNFIITTAPFNKDNLTFNPFSIEVFQCDFFTIYIEGFYINSIRYICNKVTKVIDIQNFTMQPVCPLGHFGEFKSV